MGIFTLLKDVIGERKVPFQLNSNVWFDDFAREESRRPTASFPVASLKAIGVPITLQMYRQIANRLGSAGAKELNDLCREVCQAGGISMSSFQQQGPTGGTIDIGLVISQAAG